MTQSLPLWPFAILAALLVLGYRQSRERVVQPGTLAKVALAMLALSLYGVTAAFGAHLVPVLAWAAGFATAAFVAGPVFAPQGLAREGSAVRVPGSWLPLGLMVSIFAARFVLGYATGVDAHMVHEAWFIAVASAVFGLLSGAFAARATAVHRFMRSA
ncbi:DUF6622 family protein [Roseateles sp.]|uniref:DUF6622 family protein n=1 Tax=Roseateles sp. TaxID=1971397 RepID=UPI0025EA3E2F|nr:DUF6622 family protein [Roseateles sp.]MBV8033544.1 hypothetical protein [Roseateles sp.]